MVIPKCCIPGCSYEGPERYRFPNPKKELIMLQQWVSLIGGALTTMSAEHIYNSKRICKCHFQRDYLNPGRKGLLRTAIPTLFLESSRTMRDTECVEAGPSCISKENTYPLPQMCTVQSCETDECDFYSSERKDTVTPVRLLQNIGVTRSIQLTPKKKFLYGEALDLKRKVMTLKTRCKSFKARLAAVEKLTEDEAFRRISTNMSAAAKLFTQIQYRESPRKPKGRRFSNNEKILALSIYKQSPKAYRLLQRLFTLPCHRTLTNLLSGLPIHTGINMNMFYRLQRNVELLPNKHKYCSLLFDEMKLMANLQYNQQHDCIIGFEDFGNGVLTSNFADHVLVFMVRGVVKKYKQPVAFYFCQGATKSVDLRRILKELISELQKIGLHIVCTVCDQNSTNVAAVTQLKKDTELKYIKKNCNDWRHYCFEINDKTVIPIFDPPPPFTQGHKK